jgi:hypothetical protein
VLTDHRLLHPTMKMYIVTSVTEGDTEDGYSDDGSDESSNDGDDVSAAVNDIDRARATHKKKILLY